MKIAVSLLPAKPLRPAPSNNVPRNPNMLRPGTKPGPNSGL